jgi:uracil-DNA glycosylase family 4
LKALSKEERMGAVEAEIAECRRCRLCEGRSNPVPGEGDLDSPVVFVGEAPGRREDEMGRPFVGSAGRLLDRLLGEAGLQRRDVYITNIVKCRPPGNRRPRADEVKACASHLEGQLEIIAPRILAPMGNSSSSFLMRKYGVERASIGKAHGRRFQAEASWGRVVVFPLFHPAAVLYNRNLEDALRGDFSDLRELLEAGSR